MSSLSVIFQGAQQTTYKYRLKRDIDTELNQSCIVYFWRSPKINFLLRKEGTTCKLRWTVNAHQKVFGGPPDNSLGWVLDVTVCTGCFNEKRPWFQTTIVSVFSAIGAPVRASSKKQFNRYRNWGLTSHANFLSNKALFAYPQGLQALIL